MDDRFTTGLISGALASIVQIIYGLITKAIGLTDRTFTDFARIYIMYKDYHGVIPFLIGVFTQIILCALIGIVFAFLIEKTSSKYLYIKGLGAGSTFWLLFGMSGTMYRLPLFFELPPKPALVTFIGALIYGLLLAYFLNLIEKKQISSNYIK
jgi:hypothetical protein